MEKGWKQTLSMKPTFSPFTSMPRSVFAERRKVKKRQVMGSVGIGHVNGTESVR
jgi:hypothetical protein